MANQCAASEKARTAAIADGSYQPFLPTPDNGAADVVWTEQQAADAMLAAPSGSVTWVIARGGIGKSRLSSQVEALTCARRLTFHVDVGLDLRAALDAATPGQPALAAAMLGQLGAAPGDDPAGRLHDVLGQTPWMLLLDGTDDLTLSERHKLDVELEWLQKAEFAQQIIRFERPGMVGVKPDKSAGLVLRLADLSCAEADAFLQRRFADPAVLQAAQKWLTTHRLDRKRPGNTCRYVHMSTHRDVETLADLAQDAQAGPVDDVPLDPVRADIYATWLGHRLRDLTPSREAAVIWLERIAAQGVRADREPDLRLTLHRCELAPTPGGVPAENVCPKLMQSPVVHQSPVTGMVALANLTLMDLLRARWLVRGQSDCALLTSAAANTGSLEVAMLVTSLPTGRKCLKQMVAAVCSRNIPIDDISGFADEALPMSVRDADFFAAAKAPDDGVCERSVYKALRQ